MADIQSQLEANGLPSKFNSTSEKPAADIASSNLAAAASNSDITAMVELKQPAPLEASSLVEPVAPAVVSSAAELQTQTSDQVPATNGNLSASDLKEEPKINGHKATPPVDAPAFAHAQADPQPELSFADSVVPSSIPSEIPASSETNEPSQAPAAPALEPIISPEQAPVSDLRTTPHSDRLAPEVVAVIEERKHEEDNNAEFDPPPPAQGSPSPLVAPAPIVATEAPPPAPEIPHATLPQPISEALSEPSAPANTEAKESAVTPPAPTTPAPATEDIVMHDVSPDALPAPEPIVAETGTTTKVAREREDDLEESEPASKRVKTDELQGNEEPHFKVPEPPSATSTTVPTEFSGSIKIDGDDSVTPPRLSHMKKIISNLKKSKASQAFRTPVDYVTLKIPTYPDIVKQPIDLGTIDGKLKQNLYTGVQDFVNDFELIVHNCVLFNGREHDVTRQAFIMQSSFNNQMANLPSVTEVEPSKAEKKAMKLKTDPVRIPPPRRPSVTTPSSARAPKSAGPVSATTPSFAPGPDGVPLIRRDSNVVDGRPKRAIIPPKRNSDFGGQRPKKKKNELQLRFCQKVLKEIASTKNWQLNQYFTHPVDPVALNIPTYFQVIKKPMDLGTIQQKLDQNAYDKAKDFEEDVRLIFKNCFKFNPEGDYINTIGRQLEELFDREWSQKDAWIAANEPQSEPASEGDEDEDEDGSEEDEPDSEDERNDKIKQLQAQIEAMSKQMGELTQSRKKKKITPPVDKKKSKSKGKKDKATAQFPNLSKSKDKKKGAAKHKAEKDRYVTFQEKQYISNGIAMLPEKQMQEALKIIQSSVPALANSNENEIELDIEEVPNHALLKLLSFVKKFAPPPPDEHEVKSETYSSAPTKSKKNKPMSKQEQQAQIEELKGLVGAYGGPTSPGTMQSVEVGNDRGDTGNESSDDSADSEESEEE